jgi:hypothetical protein
VSKISNKFNFFVPATFEKAKDGKGVELVKIKGIANSASAEDSDGETLFPIGFDSTPFLTKGFFNYNHQGSKTSEAICGEPTLAKAINGGKDYYVEGFLYPNKEGKAIAELAETLEKVGSNRRIGFSIEGQAIERDPFNPKKILKARISGCAITLSAKNPNTWLSIVKGEYDEAFIDFESDLEEGDPCPKCGAVYQDSGCLKCGYKEKAISTETISATVPESVEGSKKHNEKSSNFEKLISKSNIYLSIAKQYPTASIAETKSIYTLIQEVNSKMFKMENNQKVYPEAIQKAFDLLNNATKPYQR